MKQPSKPITHFFKFSRNFSKKLVLACVISVLLAGCGKSDADKNNPSAGTSSEQPVSKPTLTVTTTSAITKPIANTLSANGTVAAWQEAIISPEVNGLRVTELLVNVGDHVTKGQPLATFARDVVMNDIRLAEAALNEAKANASEAQANAERARALRSHGVLSEQNIQQLFTQEKTAQARVESARAQVSAQQLRLSQTTLRAPDSGVISSRTGSIGSVPMQGAEMFRLIRQGRLEWRGEFTAPELEQIQPNQTVRITSNAGNVWEGKVRLAAPTVDSTSRRGVAYVDIKNAEDKNSQPIRPGDYVRGELTVGSKQALMVPQSAVVARDGFHQVFVLGNDMRVSQQKVQIGRLVGDQQEILSGLNTTDKIVASGGSFLTDGDTVQIEAKPSQQAKASEVKTSQTEIKPSEKPTTPETSPSPSSDTSPSSETSRQSETTSKSESASGAEKLSGTEKLSASEKSSATAPTAAQR